MKASIIVINTVSHGILLPCINVLCNQNFDSYEVLLADLDNFTREEETILRFFENEYKNFKIVKISGKNKAELINKIAKQARGEIIFFIESHCIPSRSWVSDYFKFLKSNNAEAAIGNIKVVPSESWVSRGEAVDKLEMERNPEFYFDFHNAAVTKKCFKEMKGFSETIPYMAEFEFGARLHQKGIKIHQFPQKVYHFNNTDLKIHSEAIIRQGEDRTRMFIERGENFMEKYFPNKEFVKLLPFLKTFRLPLLLITKSIILFSSAMFHIVKILRSQKMTRFFFRIMTINSARYGRIKTLNEMKR